MEKILFRCGTHWRKIIQPRVIFLKFRCLPLPSNKNLGKISYLNSQINPWKELKKENDMVNHETKFFHCGIHRSREIFLIFKLKFLCEKNFKQNDFNP
jgi:hypothetical protein